MYIYHALINALSAHTLHINLIRRTEKQTLMRLMMKKKANRCVALCRPSIHVACGSERVPRAVRVVPLRHGSWCVTGCLHARGYRPAR